MTLSMDPEVKKLRRQVETFKEGWRIADEGRIEAEAEVARLTAERDALRASVKDSLTEFYGERCKDHDPGCATCTAWDWFDSFAGDQKTAQ